MIAWPEIVGLPAAGRRFTARRRVGLGDVTPGARLRLDALAEYLQDVATADYDDAALPGTFAFVLRRVAVEVGAMPVLGERLTLTTFCGGLGQRWAERRTRIEGDRGALVDTAAIWVSIDGTGRPVRLPDGFVDCYAEAAGGRAVTARLVLGAPPEHSSMRAWQLRYADLDTMGHINNAAHWQAAEELLQGRPLRRALVEYASALTMPGPAELRWTEQAGSLLAWLCDGGVVHSAVAVELGEG